MKLITLSLLAASLFAQGRAVVSLAQYNKLSAEKKDSVRETYESIAKYGTFAGTKLRGYGYKEVGCAHEEWLQDIASPDLGKRICAAVQARNPAVAKLHGAARVSAAMADRALNDTDLRVTALAIGFFPKYEPELLFDTKAFAKWWAANK